MQVVLCIVMHLPLTRDPTTIGSIIFICHIMISIKRPRVLLQHVRPVEKFQSDYKHDKFFSEVTKYDKL